MQFYKEHIEIKQALYQGGLQQSELDAVVIASGSQDYCFRDDIPVPFAVSSYFKEFLPLLHHPDCYVIIESNKAKPTLVYKVVADYWHSAPESLASWIADQFEVVQYSDKQQLVSIFAGIAQRVAFIGAGDAPVQAADNSVLLNWIDFHRAWKTDYEHQCLREASRAAVRGHQAAERSFMAGLSELEIHSSYLQAVGCTELELPYSNIVGLNEHAAVLHHTLLDKHRLPESRSFLLDGGAQFNGYASDITRTFMSDGASPYFVALHAGVEKLQLELVNELKISTCYTDLHYSAHRKVAALLCDLGVITASVDEAIESNLTAVFFPHGIGHLLGLQVHDRGGHMAASDGRIMAQPPEHPFLRCTRDISAGMVFTVEPGIYFIPMLLAPHREKSSNRINWGIVDKLAPYGGVRIEDDVIVHKDRNENMTRDAFSLL